MNTDHAYKLLFSEPELIIDLLQGFVHEPWVQALDFTTLERVISSYVSDDLRRRENDVIWRVKLHEHWLYVYVLIEFQSNIDRFMAVRLMTYIGLLYQDLIKTKQFVGKKQLPPVLPIVLYNGQPRWSAPTELKTLIAQAPDGLDAYLPNLHYLLLDQGRYDLTELKPLKNLVAAIFRLEQHTQPDAILDVISNLVEWLAAPEQERIRRSFSVWISQVLKPPIDELPSDLTNLAEIQTMLSQRIAQWQKQFKQEGIVEGKAEGIAEGEVKGQAKTLCTLINFKFGTLPDWAEQRVNLADTTELDVLTRRLLKAESLEQLFNGLQ